MSLLKSVTYKIHLRQRSLADQTRAYQGLSVKSRLGVGVGLLAWGVAGMYFTDQAEEKFGYKPTEKDKAALEEMKPKIHLVDREERR